MVKGRDARSRHVWIRDKRRDECKRSAEEASKQIYDDTKTRVSPVSGSSMEGAYLMTMRGPAFRRHDSYLGFSYGT